MDVLSRIAGMFVTPSHKDKPSPPAETYVEWIEISRRTQIAAVSLLTGLLYIVFSQMNVLTASADALPLMLLFHLFVLPPLLFAISLMAYLRIRHTLTRVLLFIAPVGAALANTLIVAHSDKPAVYLTEVYLIIFWTFTVSGLRFLSAASSAFLTFAISTVGAYWFLSLPEEMFVMHLFWMVAAYSFGLLGAYLLERSQREDFSSRRKLEKLATTDKLTGLLNRSKLDEMLASELDRERRFGHGVGIIMMDIDHFKSINDRFGHHVGDAILQSMALLTRENVRAVDTVFRWGGEEFVILCLGVYEVTLQHKAEALRRTIEGSECNVVEKVTASFGVTMCREGDTAETVMQRADKALYAAKRNGRNRVETA